MSKYYHLTSEEAAEVRRRMLELITPVDQQLMMCDDTQETLMLACAMLQRVVEIFDRHLTVEGRKSMLADLVRGEDV